MPGVSLRTIARGRPLTSYAKVQALVGALVRNRRWLQDTRGELLNIGCGPRVRGGFVNLDYDWRPGVLCWDVTRRLPFADRQLRGIYTEHCIEHLPFETVPQVLAECRRVLAPGSTLRIVVPDGELYARLYVAGGQLPYGEHEPSPMYSINRIMRAHGHRFIYDFQTLALLLRAAGFANIRREAYREGSAPALLIDSSDRIVESLYVEAE